MDVNFTTALRKIEMVTPESAVRQLHELFSEISKLNSEEVVAAYETVWFFRKALPFEDLSQKLLRAIEGTIVNRMLMIVSRAQKNDYNGLAMGFRETVREYHKESFDRLIKELSKE